MDGSQTPQATGLLSSLWFLIFALFGGLVRYLSKVQQGHPVSWTSLIFSLLTSGFSGLLTVLLCMATGMDSALTGFCAGMAGYMGGEALKPLEQRFLRFLNIGVK